MRKIWVALMLISALLNLVGCEGPALAELKPGVSTAAEIRAQLGAPEATWPNADGSATWEYPRGPEGVACHMLVVGADGILMRIEQALTEENFARIEKGWGKEQVRRLLGKPRGTATFPLKREEVWEWKIAPTLPQATAFFHVHFDMAGQVVGTSRREEGPGH